MTATARKIDAATSRTASVLHFSTLSLGDSVTFTMICSHDDKENTEVSLHRVSDCNSESKKIVIVNIQGREGVK